jgi:alcohol dehydrogenase class IV
MSTGYFEFWARSRVHCAAGAIVRLPALLQSLGARRVLLISDPGLAQAGLVERVTDVFAGNRSGNLPQLAGVFAEISQDAGSETVNAALDAARAHAADSIIALGGGSVLDAAKGVKYALAHGLPDIAEILQSGMRMEADERRMNVPHVAIPTTAGTGAEVTNGAVILNQSNGQKVLLVAPYLEADVAILDAQLTTGLPPSITADTGMDALTHAIEVVVNPIANHFTDALAFNAIRVIERALPRAVADGNDIQAREDMLQAASMACLALANALGASPVHNCSHAFGTVTHVAHGRANGVLLPIVMEELTAFYLPFAGRLADAFGIRAETEPQAQLQAVIDRIRALQGATGMPRDFATSGLPEVDPASVVRAIQTDPLAALFRMSVEQATNITLRALGQVPEGAAAGRLERPPETVATSQQQLETET